MTTFNKETIKRIYKNSFIEDVKVYKTKLNQYFIIKTKELEELESGESLGAFCFLIKINSKSDTVSSRIKIINLNYHCYHPGGYENVLHPCVILTPENNCRICFGDGETQRSIKTALRTENYVFLINTLLAFLQEPETIFPFLRIEVLIDKRSEIKQKKITTRTFTYNSQEKLL